MTTISVLLAFAIAYHIGLGLGWSVAAALLAFMATEFEDSIRRDRLREILHASRAPPQ